MARVGSLCAVFSLTFRFFNTLHFTFKNKSIDFLIMWQFYIAVMLVFLSSGATAMDYSCMHAYIWQLNNDGHYNSLLSSKTDISTSYYEFISRRRLGGGPPGGGAPPPPPPGGGGGPPTNGPSNNGGTVTGKAWKLTFTGIPNYDHNISDADVNKLSARPKASTDFVTGSTTASTGKFIRFGENIGYTTKSCSLGYWPPGPSCPAAYAGSQAFTLEPAPVTNSGKSAYSTLL